MKARVKATGEYIEVEQRGSTFLDTNDGSLYNVKELDLNVVDDMMSEQEKWYWKDKRIEAAIAALNGLTSSSSFEGHTLEDVIAECVILADALVEELKKGGKQ